MKRANRATWVPPWTDPRDREHPDREHGVVVTTTKDTARVRFKDYRGERIEHCWLHHLEFT